MNLEDGGELLFNLGSDPFEQQNLISNSMSQDALQAYKQLKTAGLELRQ